MSAAEQLRHHLARYDALRQHRDPAFRERLHRLQAFQARRLQHTHAALIADPKYHDATTLFLTDIYGGIDLLPMAREIEHALPMASRLLPDTVFATSAIAVDIMALTQELDEELTGWLFADGGHAAPAIDDYVAAFRAQNRFADRERQMALVRELGLGLDRYVRSRLIFTTFRMVRRPAHRYGLGTLYDFLERGFAAMRPLGSTHELFERMTHDELAILGRIAAGDPDPFLLRGKPL
ncbi:MAG: FFLEELY motif protein [Pseudomonadota bacterium]